MVPYYIKLKCDLTAEIGILQEHFMYEVWAMKIVHAPLKMLMVADPILDIGTTALKCSLLKNVPCIFKYSNHHLHCSSVIVVYFIYIND